ncbi:MAG: beta-galactosidase [Candidatus Acidiferrales bacterium]
MLLGALFLFARPAFAAPDGTPAEPDLSGARIVVDEGWPELQVDGKPFFVYGASFDYFGLPQDLWAHSLDRYKELGINTIDLTIPWNWHELAEGEFDFDGHSNPRRDLRGLLQLIADRGFKLIVHAGPQMPATWRLAGYPDWLVNAPAYGMTSSQLADGAEPALAAAFHGDGDAAAASWLAHEDFLRASHEWFTALARELAPYNSHRKISICPPDTWGKTEAKDASGPLLFVIVGDGIVDGVNYAGVSAASHDSGAPNLERYLNVLCSTLAASGVDAPCLAAAGDLPDAWLASLLAAQNTGPAQPGVAGVSGEWIFSPSAAVGEASPAGATLGERDAMTLSLLADKLEQQSSVPPLITSFHAGGYAAADESSPPDAAVSATTLGTRLLLGRGIGGIEYAPLQDSLMPAGYEAPGVNRYLNRDAALDMEGESRAQAVAIKRNGVLIKAWGERLASAHMWADLGVVDCGAEAERPENSAAAQNSSAREQLRRTLEQALRVAELAGRAPEVVDLETQPVERLLRDRVLLLVESQREPGGGAALSEHAQQTLLEYVRRGGTLISNSRDPALAVLWNTEGAPLRTIQGPDAVRRTYGDGVTIEWPQDFYSWVEPDESVPELRAHPEADWSVNTFRRLTDNAGAHAVIERTAAMPPHDSLAITELAGQEPRGPLETLSQRCVTRPLCAAGLLSATNLDDSQTGEADLDVLAPPGSSSGAYGGSLRVHVVVPPGESLLLPLHAPLCGSAVPGKQCKDEIISAGAELLGIEREQKTLELTFYAPASAKVLLRLESQPTKAELDDNSIDGQWTEPVRVFEVNLLRGAAPDYLRVLKIYLKYVPQVPEKAGAVKHPASAFGVSILNAVRLPLGQGPSLASVPALILTSSQEGRDERGERMILRTDNRGNGGVSFEARIRGPFTGAESVRVDSGMSFFDDMNTASDPLTGPAWPQDGRMPGELTLDAGQKQLRFPLVFQKAGSGGFLHYTYDFERDGSLEWVLESSALRVFLAPRDGGRMLAFVSKDSGENLVTTVGALRDWFALGADAEAHDFTFNRAYGAEWTDEGPSAQAPASPNAAQTGAAVVTGSSVGVRMRYQAPEAGSAGAAIEKTVRVTAQATLEVHYRVSLNSANEAAAGPPLQFVAVTSLPATTGEDRSTQFCWIALTAHPNAGAPPRSTDACEGFVPYGPTLVAPAGVSHLEVRTAGHAALDFEWTAGALTLVMKSDSVLLEVGVPVPPGLPAKTVLRYTVGPVL